MTNLDILSKFLEDMISSVSPQDWWVFHREELPEEMIDLVQQLFTVAASSSGVERVFSKFGLVPFKLRNMLQDVFFTMNS